MVIPGKLATASATRNPGFFKHCWMPVFTGMTTTRTRVIHLSIFAAADGVYSIASILPYGERKSKFGAFRSVLFELAQ
jgi:hypothetical protein